MRTHSSGEPAALRGFADSWLNEEASPREGVFAHVEIHKVWSIC